MRVLVATDAWRPQVNGVVRTYERLRQEAAPLDAEIVFLTPNEFTTLPCPTYPEIRLSLPGYNYIGQRMRSVQPDAVHIATEGPLGWMTRSHCLRKRIPFTTSFHTRFPDYLSQRFGIPESWVWSMLRGFHNAGAGTMVATPSLSRELEAKGFEHILPWTRGVDTLMYRPQAVRRFGEGPVFLYVGRVAVEKNIEAFLNADLPGSKVVVGDGPQLEELKVRFPDVTFTGRKLGEELAQCYASADVFVMPSRTETFGIVILEALASGLPVAAYPVTGPVDLIEHGQTGILGDDLSQAARQALLLDPGNIRTKALEYSWESAARLFVSNLENALFAQQGRKVPKRRVRLTRQRPSQA
ncbi:MAG: glycosyltransferase family 1 protein [Alphaproteobacteria bacterium]|nr:glycosyltransferase family 1 protein [Alphaproteobacteria bacterium]